jgi:hypothetical protein
MKTKSLIAATIMAALLTIALIVTNGCATTMSQTTQQRVVIGVKLAASIGGSEILMEHPDWRQQFIEASQDLSYIENADGQVGISQVIAIVKRLPVKELHSPRAILYANTGVLLLNEVGVATELPLEQSKDVKAVAAALREGIEIALEATAPSAMDNASGVPATMSILLQ